MSRALHTSKYSRSSWWDRESTAPRGRRKRGASEALTSYFVHFMLCAHVVMLFLLTSVLFCGALPPYCTVRTALGLVSFCLGFGVVTDSPLRMLLAVLLA